VSGAEWVAGYLPVILKVCEDFLPTASTNYTPGEWQRAMLGAAAALAALRILVQEHMSLLQQQPTNSRTVSFLLARALQSDLVVKSAKVAAGHSGGVCRASAALSVALVDVVKLRLLELVVVLPQGLIKSEVCASILKRALQVVARSPGKRGASSTLGAEMVNPDDDAILPYELDRPPVRLPLDDVGALVLRSWVEYDVAGGGSDVRFCQLYDTSPKGLKTVSRPLSLQLADAGVAAMIRVFSLSKVEEQVAVLGAVINNIMPVPDVLQREGALENVCMALLASLKACSERGWSIPTNPDWRARMSEILFACLTARPPALQRLAAEAISVIMRLTSDKHLQQILVTLTEPPPAPPAPKKGVPTDRPCVDARGSYALAIGCAYRYVGGMRINRYLDASDTLQRLLDWAHGTQDAGAAAAAAGAAAAAATASNFLRGSPNELTRAWILHGAALLVEYSSVPSHALAHLAMHQVGIGFSDQASDLEPSQPADLRAPPLSLSLAALAGAALVSLGPELTKESRDLRLFQALGDELLAAGLSQSVHAVECALQALAVIERIALYTSNLVPWSSQLSRAAALLEHRSTYVRRRAVSTLRQLLATAASPKPTDTLGNSMSGAGAPALQGLEKRLLRLLDMDLDPVLQEEARALASGLLLPPTSALSPMQALDLLREVVAGRHPGGALFPDSAPQADVSRIWFGVGDDGVSGRGDNGATEGKGICQQVSRKRQDSDGEEQSEEEGAEDGWGGGDGAPGACGKEGEAAEDAVKIAYQPRWQTKLFALLCLQGLVAAVAAAVKGKEASMPAAHLDLALARKSKGGAGAYLVGKLNTLVAISYAAVSSMNLSLRVEGLALLESLVRTLAEARDPDMDPDDDERGAAHVPSLLDQCQAQIASILRIALDKDNASPPPTISACNVCYELLSRGVHSDEAAIQRPLQLLVHVLVSRASERDGVYSHVASATMQISILCTLARLYISPGAHQALLRKMIAPRPGGAGGGTGRSGDGGGGDRGGTIGGGEGGARVLPLWCACVKYCVRLDARFAASAPISDDEETVSAGVFTSAIEPFLRSSAPLYLRAAAALLNGTNTFGRGGGERIGGTQVLGRKEGASGAFSAAVSGKEVVDMTLELVPLAVLLLQRECESSSHLQGSGSSQSASCSLVSALRELLTPRTIALILASSAPKAAALRDMCEVVEHISVALTCTPVHLSVADAGVDLKLHLAHGPPARSCLRGPAAPDAREDVPAVKEGVVLERLLTPLVALLQPAAYGPSSRGLRLNAGAYKDIFVISRSAKALAGVVRFFSDIHVEGKDEIQSCRAMALALPRVCVVAVSLLQPRAARLHATAAALISQVAANLQPAPFVFVLPLRMCFLCERGRGVEEERAEGEGRGVEEERAEGQTDDWMDRRTNGSILG